MRAGLLLLLLLALVPLAAATDGPTGPPRVHFSEVASDPTHDWNGDGRVTASDEFIELASEGTVDLSGWRVLINDTTPSTLRLNGSLEAGVPRAWVNPPGEVNNQGELLLYDGEGALVDALEYGSGGVPNGRSNESHEAIALVGGEWVLQAATPGVGNGERRETDPTPPPSTEPEPTPEPTSEPAPPPPAPSLPPAPSVAPPPRIRLEAPFWTGGDFDAWIDFGRRVQDRAEWSFQAVNGAISRAAGGRWLANGSTFKVGLAGDEAWRDGEITLTASSPAVTVQARFVRDAMPPELAFANSSWAGPAGLSVHAIDAVDPAPTIMFRIGRGEFRPLANHSLILEKDANVTAYAVDASGHRSSPISRVIRVDFSAPRLERLATDGPAMRYRWLDLESGLRDAEPSDVFAALPGGSIEARACDVAGNCANATVAGALSEPIREAANEAIPGHADPAPPPGGSHGRAAPAWAIAGIAGSAPAARILYRRWRRPRTLSERLRRDG